MTTAQGSADGQDDTVGLQLLNACMRNPVQLAREAATLAELSGGRSELGLGAGHTPQEFAATGIVKPVWFRTGNGYRSSSAGTARRCCSTPRATPTSSACRR